MGWSDALASQAHRLGHNLTASFPRTCLSLSSFSTPKAGRCGIPNMEVPPVIRATKATVGWDPQKKQWHVRVQIGEEVIKRPLGKTAQDADEETLRSKAVATAKDEGYEVDPSMVAIVR
jgi:hypothetical protein